MSLFSFLTPSSLSLSHHLSLYRFALFIAQKQNNITHNTYKMLLGKRQRPPINRTTSLSEIKFDVNTSIEPEVSNQQSPISQEPKAEPCGSSNGQRVVPAVDQRFLSMVSPRGNLRRHSGEFSDAGHFLKSCSLCERLLVPGRDIYMYKGDSAFCSLECRQEQMAQDERKEKDSSKTSTKESAVAATAKPEKGVRAAAAV